MNFQKTYKADSTFKTTNQQEMPGMEKRDSAYDLDQNLWKKNKKHALRAHKEKTDDKSQ
jgi:hypothetical protein